MKHAKSSTRANSAVVAALLFWPTLARAAPPVSIVVVGEQSRAFERELSAEAAEAGLFVVKREPSDVARSRVEVGTAATLLVVSPERVEIWYAPQQEGRGLAESEALAPREHEVLTAPPDTTDTTERFAARVIEQVRARLVTLSILPTRPTSDASVAPSPIAAARTPMALPDGAQRSPDAPKSRHVLWVETGVAATAAAGGLPAAIQALVGVRVSLGSVELEAFGLLPLSDGNVQAREGSADVTTSLIAAGASYVLSDEGAALRGSLGAGGGALFLSMEGEAAAPYSGREESLATAALFLDGGVRYRASDWLGVRLSTKVGIHAPRPVLEFAGREVAAWGRTFGTLALTLEFGTPFIERASK